MGERVVGCAYGVGRSVEGDLGESGFRSGRPGVGRRVGSMAVGLGGTGPGPGVAGLLSMGSGLRSMDSGLLSMSCEVVALATMGSGVEGLPGAGSEVPRLQVLGIVDIRGFAGPAAVDMADRSNLAGLRSRGVLPMGCGRPS